MRAALIDLDGTLLDTAPDLAAAANAMLADLSLAPIDEFGVRGFIGKGLAHLVRRTLGAVRGAEPDERTLERALKSFEHHYALLNGLRSALYPGVREGLAALRSRGARLACVTNKPARFTQPLLEHFNLARYFDAVVSGDSVARGKPDPEPLLAACSQLGVAISEAVMIGDSANDALAARAAGCRVLLVPYGYAEAAALRNLDCDGIVESLLHAAQLPAIWTQLRDVTQGP